MGIPDYDSEGCPSGIGYVFERLLATKLPEEETEMGIPDYEEAKRAAERFATGIDPYDAPHNGQNANRAQLPLVRLHERLLLAINRNREVVYALDDLLGKVHDPGWAPPPRATEAIDLSLVEVLNKGPGLINENTEAALFTINAIEKALFEPREPSES